ncbi:MAG: fasciclin domain-containing protein [Bacteroidales bacterium]|nr:fasciclin domain-containing protein [Bacteroidales bacterium]
MSKIKYILTLMLVMMLGCEEKEIQRWEDRSTEQQITEYIIARDTIYSEFKKAMDIGNMSGLLNTRGPFTLFLPDNKAMYEYYDEVGINSIEEYRDSINYWRNLVLNHVIPVIYKTNDIPPGAIPTRNGLDDFLVADIEFVNGKGYLIINKESYVTDENEETANGVIHRVNKVIKIIKKPTPSILDLLDEYKIFVEGLKRSGIYDTLNKVTVPYGLMNVRTRYTILAVPDSVYYLENIFSIEDLIARFDDKVGEITDATNGFYKYMDYHCLEGTHYTSAIYDGSYPTMSREGLLKIITDGLQFKINPDPETGEYTEIIVKNSNIPAKNGTIHTVNTILEEKELPPEVIHIEMTEFPDIMEMDCFRTELRNFMDPENSFVKIKWKTAPYCQYYYKPGEPCSYNDCIVMAEGYWEVEATIPKIKKGKYQMISRFKKGGNRANIAVYVDGVRKEEVIVLNDDFGYFDFPIFDVDWKTTAEHKVKLKTITPGIVMWDYLEFRPIEE